MAYDTQNYTTQSANQTTTQMQTTNSQIRECLRHFARAVYTNEESKLIYAIGTIRL